MMSNCTLSNTMNVAAMPSMKAKSATRVTMNALMAAAFADGPVYQKPISR